MNGTSKSHGPLVRIRTFFQQRDPVSACLVLIGWGCYILAALLLAWVVGAVVHNDIIERSVADDVAAAPASWPNKDQLSALNAARTYNNALQKKLDGHIPADAQNSDGTIAEIADTTYMQTLSVNSDGAMARLRIPKISVNIAVYHTTLDNVLDKGVGHIYGTALPVGDAHTYTALAAHSGGVQGMLFTRLHEMKQGDVFYIDVLGSEQGYRITDIRTVKPEVLEQTLQVLRTNNQDKNATVTMVTCTPIGVNTDRLLVTGVREPIPDSIPESSTQSDGLLLTVGAGIIVFIIALIAAIIVRRIYLSKHKTPQ